MKACNTKRCSISNFFKFDNGILYIKLKNQTDYMLFSDFWRLAEPYCNLSPDATLELLNAVNALSNL